MPGSAWEYTPRDGVTHIRGCGLCTNFKEHLIIAEAINCVNNPEGNSAWKTRNRYERELILLGWDLANEQGRPSLSISTVEVVMGCNHYLMQELETLYRRNIRAAKFYNELLKELKGERVDAALPNNKAEFWQCDGHESGTWGPRVRSDRGKSWEPAHRCTITCDCCCLVTFHCLPGRSSTSSHSTWFYCSTPSPS